MNWLDRIVEKWNFLVSKVRPVWDVIVAIFRGIGKVFALLWKYIFMFRGIIISAPLAAAAVIVSVWARKNLPEMVEITHLVLDKEAEGSIFGLFVMTTEAISRDVAVFVPLVLTGICIVMTILSKRTLYPWLIGCLTLCLPIVMYLLNTYPT
jgi:hypothetical protein